MYLLYTYFGVNLMLVGSYILDRFNTDNKLTKLFFSAILLFFGVFLLIYESTIADKVAKWWDSSELNFLWRVYIVKKYDNLKPKQVEYIKKQFSEEKDKNSNLYKHLKLILKRNGSKKI
jgi:hypothetical protein